MSIVKMTVQEYAECRKISPGAVRKAIRLGHALPGVVYMERFGKVHVLYVDKKKVKKHLEVTQKILS